MVIAGIVVGFIVFMLTGGLLGNIVLHDQDASAFPAVVAGIWATWPFFHTARVQRYNFLHPIPMEYSVPIKVAFGKIRDFLAEASYNYGDTWRVATADPEAGRIIADLRFTDEEVHFETDGRGNFHTRKERLQRFVGLEIGVKRSGQSSVVQCDFYPKTEGNSFFACDSVVSHVHDGIESALGQGKPVGSPQDTTLPAPPWWLLGLTALMLLTIIASAVKVISDAFQMG